MTPMLNARQREIVELLRREGQQSIQKLAERYLVATQTIRRDINQLCDYGLARRVHGGVASLTDLRNVGYHARRQTREEVKRLMAAAVAAKIPNGSTVFLGIGTSVQFVAEALSDHEELTIVTNNLDVASILCAARHLEVHMAPGVVRPDDRDVAGLATIAFFQRFVANFGVIGAGALDPERGVLDFDHREREVADVILANARTRVLVADASKWRRTASNVSCGFENLDLFVTDAVPAAAREALTGRCGAVIETAPSADGERAANAVDDRRERPMER